MISLKYLITTHLRVTDLIQCPITIPFLMPDSVSQGALIFQVPRVGLISCYTDSDRVSHVSET